MDRSQNIEPKIFQKMFAVLEMEPQINWYQLKIFLYNMVSFKSKVYFKNEKSPKTLLYP